MKAIFVKENLPLIIIIIVVLIIFFYIQSQIANINTEISNLNKLINISNSLPEQSQIDTTPYNIEELPEASEPTNELGCSLPETFFSFESFHPESPHEPQPVIEELPEKLDDKPEYDADNEEQSEAEIEDTVINIPINEEEQPLLLNESSTKECIAIIKSGKKKGQQCNKNTTNINSLCNVHDK